MCLGIPGQIVEIVDEGRQLAMVEISGVRRKVNVACIAGDGPLDGLVGAWALIHVGFAMSVIDEAEAARTLDVLRQLGDAQAEIEAMHASARMLAT
ncbi:HypC/HybG/HupF family hydrogenase formation chaperone [soil metagenome]